MSIKELLILDNISSLTSIVHLSSESKLKIHSLEQNEIAWFLKSPYPLKGMWTTFAPKLSAISVVPSELWESATMISSTHRTLLIQSLIFSDSL